ncbi:alpha/beta hydrolase [Microbulbifer sp. Q7]|uniref:alpha/beta hydrolase n=1 Tax=Microbulbifer sp. Q7 TaxID=1785091 RepID=UPI00083594B1|nr:alpha/beta hydrolase [Microbulbifer sp. Q7]
MNTLVKLLLVGWMTSGLLMVAATASGEPRESGYKPVAPNPSYNDVTALTFREYDRKVPYGEHPDQYGLLWLPDDPEPKGKPTVVLVHGGCWLSAYDINHTRALATALALEGYPVWSLEYRRSDENASSWPQSLHDLQRGVQAIRKLPLDGLNHDEVVLVGHSAGGHLALLLAASWGEVFAGQAPRVSALGLAAITDIADYAGGTNGCQKAAALFMGAAPGEAPAAYAAANPATLGINVPVILLQGDGDQIVPRAQLESLRADNVTTRIEPGAGHFDWVHPGTPAFQTLLETLSQLQNYDA